MKKYQMGIAAVLLMGMLAAGAFAMGFRGHNDPAVTAAIKADDYTAFNAALAANNVTKKVTQDQFEKIVKNTQRRTASLDAIKNNDYAAWTAAGHSETKEVFTAMAQEYNARQKVQQAIASNDFATWKQSMSDLLQLQQSQLTQEQFDQIVAHKAAHPRGMRHGRW